MSQAKISIPFDILDDPRCKSDHVALWCRLEVLRVRQRSDCIQLHKGYPVLCHLSGMMLRKVVRLLADLLKFGHIQSIGVCQLTLSTGAKYSGNSLCRKEPIPEEPNDTPPIPEPEPSTSEPPAPVAAEADDGDAVEDPPTVSEASEKSEQKAENESVARQEEVATKWLASSMCQYPKGWRGVQAYWNQIAEDTGMPSLKYMTKKRKTGVYQRLKDKSFPGPDDLVQAITEQKDFLAGERTGWNATFDWIFCCKGNWCKIMERNYVRNGRPARTQEDRDAEELRKMYEAEEARERDDNGRKAEDAEGDGEAGPGGESQARQEVG